MLNRHAYEELVNVKVATVLGWLGPVHTARIQLFVFSLLWRPPSHFSMIKDPLINFATLVLAVHTHPMAFAFIE